MEEDGTERKKSGICKVCEDNCVESTEHVLMKCKAYHEERESWRNAINMIIEEDNIASSVSGECVVGKGGESGVGCVSVGCVGGVGGGPSPLEIMLGRKLPGVSANGWLRMLDISTRFLETLWNERAIKIHGPRRETRGVNDVIRYGTK